MKTISFCDMSQKTTFFKIICITSVICFTFLMCGSSRMFIAFMISQLRTEIGIDEDQASWLGSLSSLCNPIGFLFGGFSMDKFGRKWSTQCTFIPFFAGWLIIHSSKSLYGIYIGVALHGIASGMTMVSSVYVSEISSPRYRGFASSLLALSYMLGSLISCALQCLVSWRHTASCFLLTSIVMLVLVRFIPESPYWLIMKGLHSQAGDVLETIRGGHEMGVSRKNAILLEMADICEHVRDKSTKMEQNLTKITRLRLKLNALSCIWKQMLILVVFTALHRLSGFVPLSQYTVLFFNQLGTPTDGDYASLGHSSVCFVTMFAVPYCFHFYDRRILLFITSILAGFGITLTCLYEVAKCQYPDQSKPYSWVPIVGVYVYDVATTLGITSILVMLPAELLPTEISGSALTLFSISTSLITTFISKTYFKILACIGLVWLLSSFIVTNFALALLSILLLPETRGKTLREIQQHFNKNADASSPTVKKTVAI